MWHSLIYGPRAYYYGRRASYNHIYRQHARIIYIPQDHAVQAILYAWRGRAAISKTERKIERVEGRAGEAAGLHFHRCCWNAMRIVSRNQARVKPQLIRIVRGEQQPRLRPYTCAFTYSSHIEISTIQQVLPLRPQANLQEVSLSCLYVSSKLHDTLKKPRDIILASYSLRYPNLVKKGTIDPTALDARMLEDERLRVLTVERLVLETICFKFGVDSALGIVIKIAKALECEWPLASLD